MGTYVLHLDIKLRSAILIDGTGNGKHVVQLPEVVVDDILLPYIVLQGTSFPLVLRQAVSIYLHAYTRKEEQLGVICIAGKIQRYLLE